PAVAGLAGRVRLPLSLPTQAEGEVLARIAVAVNRPDPGALAQVGLPEDEVPALPGPQVRGGQGQARQAVGGPLRFQNFVQDVAGQDLRVAPTAGGCAWPMTPGEVSMWWTVSPLNSGVIYP